jgi:hypothetical protein
MGFCVRVNAVCQVSSPGKNESLLQPQCFELKETFQGRRNKTQPRKSNGVTSIPLPQMPAWMDGWMDVEPSAMTLPCKSVLEAQ